MELLGVLFITFFYTTIFLFIRQRKLLQSIKEIKKDYFDLCDKLYEITYIQEGNCISINTKLKDNIKTLIEEDEFINYIAEHYCDYKLQD